MVSSLFTKFITRRKYQFRNRFKPAGNKYNKICYACILFSIQIFVARISLVLVILDFLFFVLHVAVIGFNLFGWIWLRTRKLHLWIVGVTLFSWLVLGIWYGFGYCILTDWHWEIKNKLGQTNLPNSFISYLTNSLLGLDWSNSLVDGLTVGLFFIAIVVSVYLNFFRKSY